MNNCWIFLSLESGSTDLQTPSFVKNCWVVLDFCHPKSSPNFKSLALV